MPAPSADRAFLSFEIKSAQLPLVAFLPRTVDQAVLARDWAQRYGDMPDFFDQDPLLIDLTLLNQANATPPALDFPSLLALLRTHRLRPVAVKAAQGVQRTEAEAAGLVCADEASLWRVHEPIAQEQPAPVAATNAPTPEVAAPLSTAPGALVIDKPLRSGQQVYARGRDLVVMAMVNPGAEVIADGHIHVYAPLRGKAIAGARGWQEARITALAMEPELIAIAGVYRTSETPLPPDVQGKPSQVRLSPTEEGGKLLIQALA